jgi:hypothetical protein
LVGGLDGETLADGCVRRVYAVRDGLVGRMDVAEGRRGGLTRGPDGPEGREGRGCEPGRPSLPGRSGRERWRFGSRGSNQNAKVRVPPTPGPAGRHVTIGGASVTTDIDTDTDTDTITVTGTVTDGGGATPPPRRVSPPTRGSA